MIGSVFDPYWSYYDLYIAWYQIWLSWIDILLDISDTCGGAWSNGVGQNREIDKEHVEDCVKKVFELARVKNERDG